MPVTTRHITADSASMLASIFAIAQRVIMLDPQTKSMKLADQVDRGELFYSAEIELNGKKVRDRDERLERLFRHPSPSALERARKILEESARYNIGGATRTACRKAAASSAFSAYQRLGMILDIGSLLQTSAADIESVVTRPAARRDRPSRRNARPSARCVRATSPSSPSLLPPR